MTIKVAGNQGLFGGGGRGGGGKMNLSLKGERVKLFFTGGVHFEPKPPKIELLMESLLLGRGYLESYCRFLVQLVLGN